MYNCKSILWKSEFVFNDLACLYTVVNLIDNYYTNAHEELHRHRHIIVVEGR